MISKDIIIFLIIFSFISCSPETRDIIELPNPISGQTETPYLSSSKNGTSILSWTEVTKDTVSELMFSIFDGTVFSPPKSIAKGTDWFVNWADCPSVIALDNNNKNLVAHWLQKSANGTYDYDIRISISEDSGNSWSNSFILHDDNIAAEHGFVTMKPISDNELFITWLDGRNTKSEVNKDFKPRMILRAAVLNINGKKSYDVELDSMVCDCCQTDVTIIDKKPFVIYRDRSESEIRDISYSYFNDSKWTPPQNLYPDNWKIAGCPVNGPRISSSGKTSVISWYTESDQNPKIYSCFVDSKGNRISDPIVVDMGNALGRVDNEMLDNENAIVSWMEKTGTDASIFARIISKKGFVGDTILVGKNSAARSSGFPVLSKINDQIIFAYTQIDGDDHRIKTKALNLKNFNY